MKKIGNKLLRGAFFLLLANTLARLLGFLYRVVLVRILGAEGIGLTELVSPLYNFCLVIAGWGISLAMSRFLARELHNGNRYKAHVIWRCGLFLLTLSGAVVSIAAFWAAPTLIQHFAADERVLLSFQVLCPAVFIVSISSAYRGYFHGNKDIAVIGGAQNVEQFLRVISGALLAYFLLPYGIVYAIAGVSAASLIGETGGLLYIARRKNRQVIHYTAEEKKRAYVSRRNISKELVSFGTSVTLQRLLSSLVMMLQAMLLPQALMASGMSPQEATAAYGTFAGVAMSLLHLPGVFTSTMATALLPVVAQSAPSSATLKKRINLSLAYAGIISFPVALVFHQYGAYFCDLLFHCPEAGEALSILAYGAVFFYLQPALTSILQGLGKVKTLLFHLAVSGSLLIAGFYFLVPIPALGIKGAAYACVISTATGCLLHLICTKHCTGLRVDWLAFLGKPILSCLPVYVLFRYTTYPPLVSIALGAAVYLGILALLKGLPQKPQ